MTEKKYGIENAFSTQKTLRFELQPVGETLENMERKGLIAEDIERAEAYRKAKKIIDEYHRAYIEEALRDVQLEGVEDCFDLYSKKNKTEKENADFKKKQAELRKQIKIFLTASEKYKRIDKKELIEDDLLEFVKDCPEDTAIVKSFKGFTTYFRGFNENRKNMYSDEEKSTAIAFRAVNQNMLRYFDNYRTIEKLLALNPDSMAEKISDSFADILKDNKLEDFFGVENYSSFLMQSGLDKYNQIIGGYSPEEGVKVRGINEYVNLYNQKNKVKLPKMKPLYKQILSVETKASFLPEVFVSDSELLGAMSNFYNTQVSTVSQIKLLLSSLKEYDNMGIFVRNDRLNQISKKLLGDPLKLKLSLEDRYDEEYDGKIKFDSERYVNERKKHFDTKKSYSLYELSELCEEDLAELYIEKANEYFDETETAARNIEELINLDYPTDRKLSNDKESVKTIKNYLDSLKSLQQFVKPLLGSQEEAEKDEAFYGDFMRLWDELDVLTPLYNKVRNYITKKPYSTEKVKLNFQNSTLAAGWDQNKEESNLSVLFRKDGMFYLGIMDKSSNKIFRNIKCSTDEELYEKMEYKLLPGPNKMLPKVFLSKKGIEEFKPSQEILDIYERGSFKKGDDFSLEDCHCLIDYFKECIDKHKDYKNFNFKFSDTKSYKDISEFYREVQEQGYKLSFKPVSKSLIDGFVKKGQLYLFRIWNKDFSEYSKGTPNLHTLYWKMLFDPRNLENVVYKLNGEAEVFYRKASISPKDTVTHYAHQELENKNVLNPKKTSIFEYDLVKDRRYTMDKFHLHVPITLNFKANGGGNINNDVREYLKYAKDTYIIGINRGERNLLYVCVIDSEGKIVEQYSLNEIITEYKGNSYHTDYQYLLSKRGDEREKARQEWGEIESIKELKEGYISQVVHKICELMLKYKAIVVLEDLNGGFKNSRKKVEKQVYQKFEKMLIEKLNYLVDKKADVYEPGGLLNALQLTSKFQSFEKLFSQSGMLFYVPAWNTSKIDPTTGFTNLFAHKDLMYSSVDNALEFWKKFDLIRYDEKREMFAFEFDYNSFTARAEGSQSKWTAYSNGTRLEAFRDSAANNNFSTVEVDLVPAFKELFGSYNIEYSTADLKAEILKINEKGFHQKLLKLFRLTLQMRNSVSNTDIDYMISPILAKDGTFFDSRLKKEGLPIDADANGAYHIAKKGLWIIQKLKMTREEELPQVNLRISNAEWLDFVQKGVK